MVDGAGTEVVLISSSPEVLAHHSPPDTTRKDESLSFPFNSLSLSLSLCLSSPILPTLYTLEYSFSTILLISLFLFFPRIVSTRFREPSSSSPNSSNLRYFLSFSQRGKKNEAESTDLENPVARIPLSIETCHVSCVEV